MTENELPCYFCYHVVDFIRFWTACSCMWSSQSVTGQSIYFRAWKGFQLDSVEFQMKRPWKSVRCFHRSIMAGSTINRPIADEYFCRAQTLSSTEVHSNAASTICQELLDDEVTMCFGLHRLSSFFVLIATRSRNCAHGANSQLCKEIFCPTLPAVLFYVSITCLGPTYEHHWL